MMRYILIILLLTSCAVEKSKRSQSTTKDSLATNNTVRKDTLSEGSKRTETNTSNSTGRYEKETIQVPVLIRDTLTNTVHHYYQTTIKEKGETATASTQVIVDTAYKMQVNEVLIAISNRLISLEEKSQKDKKSDVSWVVFALGGLFLIVIGVLAYMVVRLNSIRKG